MKKENSNEIINNEEENYEDVRNKVLTGELSIKEILESLEEEEKDQSEF